MGCHGHGCGGLGGAVLAGVTAISGIKYLWDNRSFINTAK